MKKLKSLDSHNAQASASHSFCYDTPVKNGIACPKCGQELYDTNPMMTLTSNPPKKNIACKADNCDYSGYRIA